jgi:flagellar basal-body rod protein FlgF
MSKIASRVLTAGMKTQMRRLDFVTNNIANSTTPGFKATMPLFQGLLEEQMKNEGLGSPFSKPALAVSIDFSEAPLMETGGSLDLAIEGAGFFVISTPEGLMYTRNGQFSLDKGKRLVTSNGYPAMGENGEIVLNGKTIKIENDGSFYVDQILAGKIKVIDFSDRTNLQNHGKSLFAYTGQDNMGITSLKYSVKQGFIESSNVNITQEMINLINCLRSYQAHDKVKQFINGAHSKMLTITERK